MRVRRFWFNRETILIQLNSERFCPRSYYTYVSIMNCKLINAKTANEDYNNIPVWCRLRSSIRIIIVD